MPDPVLLPVSLQQGSNARNAAPQPPGSPGQGADAPFALSLAQLLRDAAGLSSQQDVSAGGGTDLPPADQNLPPGDRPGVSPESGFDTLGKQEEMAHVLTAGTGVPVLSGEAPPADTVVMMEGGQLQDRPLASQLVLRDSQRELSSQMKVPTAEGMSSAESGVKQERGAQTGQLTLEGVQSVRTDGQPARTTEKPVQSDVQLARAEGQSARTDGQSAGTEGQPHRTGGQPEERMQAHRPEVAGQPVHTRHRPVGEPAGETVGNTTRPDTGAEWQSPNGIREGELARGGEQTFSDRSPGQDAPRQDGVVQHQRDDGQRAGAATRSELPAAVAAASATDGSAQSQTVAATGIISRTTDTGSSDGVRRPAERAVSVTKAPAWQSGRSSEPLELASSVAGDRLQRFAEQWAGHMNERSGQSAWQGNGASNTAGTTGQAAGSASSGNDGGGPANSPVPQTPASSVPSPSTATQTGTMPPLPSLTTMPGSSVEAASRSALNPDAALAGGREALGSTGSGQGSAREQWGEALSQRISLMTARNQSEARIQLDPPELGRLMIQIQVNSEQASVSFTSPHAMVREALEANVPRLQDMLSEQGLDLLDVDISDQSQEQADEQGEEERSLQAGAGDDGANADEAATPVMTEGSLSLVDDYV